MASYFETWLHLSTLVYFSYLLCVKNFEQISYIISFPKSISGIERAYQLHRGLNQDPRAILPWVDGSVQSPPSCPL